MHRRHEPTSHLPSAVGQPSVAVVGSGNWLVAHDRIGPTVIEAIQDRYGDNVAVLDIGTQGLALLDCLDGQDCLIVVDAARFGGTPGQIRVFQPDLQSISNHDCSVHQIGPMETLAIVQTLWPEKVPKETILIAVETEGLNVAEEQRACAHVVEVIDRELATKTVINREEQETPWTHASN